MEQFQNLIRSISKCLFLFLLILAATELPSHIALKLLRPGANDAFDPSNDGTRLPSAPHPYLGYVYNPEKNTPRMTEFHRAPVNSLGFLSWRDSVPKREPEKRIIGIFGGSVANWLSVRGADRLRAILARSPAFAGKKLELYSTALGGYKQPQQLMALNFLLALGAEFDLVVNIDGFNEVALPTSQPRFPPSFPRGWVEMTSNHALVLSTLGRLAFLEQLRKEWNDRTARLGFSATARLVSRLGDTLLRRLGNRERAILARFPAASPVTDSAPIRDPAKPGFYEELADLWENASWQMAALCASRGIPYFHFLQPNQHLPGTKPMGEAELRIASRPAGDPFRRAVADGYPVLIARGPALRRKGIRFFDLTLLFEKRPEPLYEDDCCHLNQRGNALLAEAIGKAIVRSLVASPSQITRIKGTRTFLHAEAGGATQRD